MTSEASNVWFTSLGMLVLDELRFTTHTVTNVPGGSGAYATLGARLFRPSTASKSIGWMIYAGDDMSTDIRATIEQWRCSLNVRSKPGQSCTRGLLTYLDDLGTKTFEYTTPVLQITPSDLESTSLLASRAFHTLASPGELISQVNSLMQLRLEAGITYRPLIVWEPRPSSCKLENMVDFIEAMKLVNICSPNHIECAQLFGHGSLSSVTRNELEEYANTLLESFGDSGAGSNTRAIIIRAGEHGCLIVSKDTPARWLPSYYGLFTGYSRAKVVDPTGAGNAFLGAFSIGLIETGNLARAACYGSVGASFALEQIGLPKMERLSDIQELWNGVDPKARLAQFLERIQIQ